VKSSYCIFAVRPKNFHFSSIKEIENQLKTFKNFWLINIRLLPLHSLKTGWQLKAKKIFESWEATALLIISGIGKSSENNSI
jgi:hypothetical protein